MKADTLFFRARGLVFGLLFSIFLLFETAHAQDRSERPFHLPYLTSQQRQELISKPIKIISRGTDHITDMAVDLREVMNLQFKELQKSRNITFACDDLSSTVNQIRYLRSSGLLGNCIALGSICSIQKPQMPDPILFPELLVEAATCAQKANNFVAAKEFYTIATSEENQKSPVFLGAVLKYAYFAYSTDFAQEVEAILNQIPDLSPDELRLYKSVIEYFYNGTSNLISEKKVEQFILKALQGNDEVLAQFVLINWAEHLISDRYLNQEGLDLLKKYVHILQVPDDWFAIAYRGFYHFKDNYFQRAELLYDAYIPYSHSYSWLPIEQNTRDYSEIYAQKVCPNGVTQPGQGFEDLQKLKSDFLSGALTLDQAITQAEALRSTYLDKADILTFLGALSEASDQDFPARIYHFQAHKACAYYNRSHWGIANIDRRIRYSVMSDYGDGFTRIDQALATVHFDDAQLDKYVLNWKSLTQEAQKRLKYSLRFWVNHIDSLVSKNVNMYIKYGFQLLSEVPGASSMKNTRIDFYPGDNRLWDDVRGMGGDTVVVDLGEMMAAAWGAYNLGGHEVAHQFHQNSPQAIQNCITKLYQNAKKRGVFPDPYAANYEAEYFGQGVSYYMIAANSPKRFGLNVQWLIDNDADLYNFLKNIEQSKDMGSVTCPVK